ncbi:MULTISPECIES: arylsulfatase [unclassified Imperialibacter]|uniref:sulfatase family protein n=1 Tax=unclassified Imperialibacter TaxID=2629706 RepID=UPI001254D7FB|nr:MULTISPECIES: arylsulfatase [unclassified Imperialibacter]CAD5276773.1 Arylsulfatase [Imperialibacter sp. 89]CAD5295139.1 Arylsulfatase [Imperialibacter sp. 75]VVT29078.1 Arylsulfatase [Imperialibacter sp. EC-SDR9]
MPMNVLVRRNFLVSATLLCLAGCDRQTEEPEKPNIIYVLADDMGYGDVSAFNADSKIKTPFIDQLATEGMMFTDAHSGSSVCTPTRYGILTGRYSWRTRLKEGVLSGNSKPLIAADRTTIGSMLQKNGYYTAFIGKWHLGWDWGLKDEQARSPTPWSVDFSNINYALPVKNSAKERGFDFSYGHPASLDMSPYVYVENGMVTAVPDTTTVNTGEYSWWREGPTAPDFVHEEVTPNYFKKAMALVEDRALSDQPFFLYLALPSPHTPILPTKEWQEKSGLNPYGDFVMMIDDYVGQLMRTIKAAGIEENTLVIFTSDNGFAPYANFELLEAKGHYPSGPFRGYKADIFEGGHRIPFIAKWPGVIESGSVSSQTICLTDLMATCADIAGHKLAPNEGEDSYSLLPIFKQTISSEPLREGTVHHSMNGSFAIRRGPWKLILCPDSGGWSDPKPQDSVAVAGLPAIQLYHLANDPGEKRNLEAEQPGKVAELKALLAKYIQNGRSTAGETQKNDSYEGEWVQVNFIKQP